MVAHTHGPTPARASRYLVENYRLVREALGILREEWTWADGHDDYDDPILEPCAPWEGIVVHGLPANIIPERVDGTDDIEYFETRMERVFGGQVEDAVKGVRVMCKDREWKNRSTISVRLMVVSTAKAEVERALKEGLFYQNTHCRVSRYHSTQRRKQAGQGTD